MITFAQCRTAVAVASMVAAGCAFAEPMSKAEYKASKDRIEADYKADKATCDQASGNAKDICKAKASGKEKVAKAELEYQQSGKPADGTKAAVAKADADYDVAKEMCDDKGGQAKDECLTEAKTAHKKAVADAKLEKKVNTARADNAEDKRDADYKLAVQKCDTMAGDAKISCVADAKARFGKG